MITRIVFAVVAITVSLLLWRLLRAGRLREKYAALWILVGAAVLVLAFWPGLLNGLADAIGIALPVNLLFFLSIVLLLGVGIHLSTEVSRLEDETRILNEEIALLWEATGRSRAAHRNVPGTSGHGASTAPRADSEDDPQG